MSQEEPTAIQVQIYHELIGNHTFEFSSKTHTSDLRLHIQQNSPLYIYQNFHLQHQGSRLPDCNQISEIFKGDVRLQIVFDPYDEYSSRYHEERVKRLLQNPVHWLVINTRDFPSKTIEEDKQKMPTLKLDQLFDNPFASNLLNFNEKKESDFGTMIGSSGFNPPPLHRKLQGDLYYIHVRTLEEVDFHITATAEGFMVNQSSQGNFNANTQSKYPVFLSLLDLLFQLSPKFKAKFQELQKSLRLTEFQKMSLGQKGLKDGHVWMVEGKCWKKNNLWRNDSYQHSEKSELTIVKDWVEIFQYQMVSSSDTIYQKIGKEKLRYRIYQQFVQNIKECVLKIFNGMIEPLNKASKMQHQLYYYCSLLFYFANDQLIPDGTLPSGYGASKQVLMLSIIQQLDVENIHLSRSAVVKYRGYKIVVKTIPNFMINTNLEFQSIRDILKQSGCNQNDDSFLTSLRKICKGLGVESQNLMIDKEGAQKLVCVSPDLVTCTSKEKKRFILETKAFAPRDLNFNKPQAEQCYIRPELMRLYNSRQKCTILYNPNIGTGYQIANLEKYKNQQKKLESVAKFAKQILVPALIDSFDGEMRKYLADSHGVVHSLHKFGLSSKYLGLLCKKAVEKQAHHVQIIIERTILVRSLKTLFKKAMRESPLHLHKTIIKHLLNCLFNLDTQNGHGNHRQTKNDEDPEYSNGKKNKKKRVKENETCFEIFFGKVQDKYCHIKKEDFWQELKLVAMNKFKHNLADKASYFEFQFSKVAILRDLCICLGIIIEKKDYFCSESKTSFTQENIINIVPKVKVILSEPKQLNEWIEEGDKQSSKFQIEQAFQSYNKAFQYMFTSFGEMHQKLGLMYKKFSHLHFKVGDVESAVLFAMNSYEIYQHLLGFDHVETIEALMMIGIYNFGRKKFDAAEYYLLKAIFLAKFAYSECYPEVMVMHMNLSTVYEAQKKFTDAIMSLFMALNISIKVYGNNHLHTAIIFSALASLHYDIPDIEQAIRYQQRSISILEELLGSEDERVVEAKNICEGYRNIQNSKKVREVHEKEQKNPFGLPSFAKFNQKGPLFDMRERPADFVWKKPKKLRYFF